MESTQSTKINAKDLFLNLGAFVALYTVVISLINLLFTVIDKAYPQTTYFGYYSSANISWPVAVLVIFFPILILLYWFLEKEYALDPERQKVGVHKWLSYLTLFFSGLALAGDLVTVLYYFLNGDDLTTAFLLKVFVVLIIASAIFAYFISDIRGKLSSQKRMFWRVVAGVMVVASIAWGFYVLGSPQTQRLYKYDDQKVMDLQSINSYVQSFYSLKGALPATLDDIAKLQYTQMPLDKQSNVQYEYHLVAQSAKSYQLCATFNKPSQDQGNSTSPYMDGGVSWKHEAGHKCFDLTIPLNMYVPSPKGI